jgi:hypothetical protein
MTTTNEQLLDGLYKLQHQRIREISEKGAWFRIGNSSVEKKGLLFNDGKIYFEPSTGIYPGVTVKASNSTEYLIKSVVSEAGRIVADTVPATTQLSIVRFISKGVNAITKKEDFVKKTVMTNVPAATYSWGFAVPASSAPQPGDIVKGASPQLFEVVSTLFTGGIAFVNVAPWSDPLDKTTKYADAYNTPYKFTQGLRDTTWSFPGVR